MRCIKAGMFSCEGFDLCWAVKAAALCRLWWKQHQSVQKPKEHLSRIMFFVYNTDVLLHDSHFSELFSGKELRQSWKRGQRTDNTMGTATDHHLCLCFSCRNLTSLTWFGRKMKQGRSHQVIFEVCWGWIQVLNQAGTGRAEPTGGQQGGAAVR